MKKKNNDWKKRDGVVYSTSDDFQFQLKELFQTDQEDMPLKQEFKVQLDKKNRRGKHVTLITGFRGTEKDLRELGKELKSKCGVGGSAKDAEILIQGDHRDKVIKMLQDKGHQVKRVGGKTNSSFQQ